MKNCFKILGIVFIMTFAIILGNGKFAFANPLYPDRTVYYQGEKIKAHYAVSYFGNHAWIGLVNIDTDKINDPQDIKGMTWIGQASGDVEFEVPNQAGHYKIVIYPGDYDNLTYKERFLATEHVLEVSPKNIDMSLNKYTDDLNVGETDNLVATTTPAEVVSRIDDDTDETTTVPIKVEWKSSDESVATVDLNGKVTGIKEGQATITATMIDGSGIIKTCTVNVIPEGNEPTNQDPTGEANLFIELVDGQIKQYTVSSDEINKFTEWYEKRDNDHSLPATYKFNKGSYTDYVVQNQIDWFEVR